MQSEEEVLKELKRSFKVPSGFEIIKKALDGVLSNNIDNPEWIKLNFSKIVEKAQIDAYKLYLSSERPAAIKSIKKTFKSLLPNNATASDLFELLDNNFWSLDKFFLGLTQGRRPRAGKAFEQVIDVLFNILKYPYSSQPVINGKPDFLLPSIEHYKKNPMDCIIFTVKRTLRERWRQITTEGTRGYQFFLATIDEGVKKGDLSQMLANRIYLVVPENIKDHVYESAENVISFESFFKYHLDPFMKKWQDNNVI